MFGLSVDVGGTGGVKSRASLVFDDNSKMLVTEESWWQLLLYVFRTQRMEMLLFLGLRLKEQALL